MGRLEGRVALVTGAGRGFGRELPVRHLGEVADVAYCAGFLAAEDAHYLTGQVLQPNGGWVMA